MHVVATAGHVDHGKSTLVRALTGVDPDRFREEKERGLTIDLGFAGLDLPSGRGVAFVDVPGHVRFLRNMLAGVGAVDACLFVVAATEGWKPQSEEHLRILELLGVGHGVVVLTKVAVADDDLRELARLDVADHLEGSFLEPAEVVEVDAPAGHGLADLVGAVDRLTGSAPTAVDHGRARLWVDRSFAPTGVGTVVTGTLAGGGLAVDDALEVVPPGIGARVRGLQRLHRQVGELGPGNRAAVNLAGIAHDQVGRGDALVRRDEWHLTATVDAELHVLDSVERPVSRRGAHLAYLGSGEHPVRLRVLGPDAIAPGETGLVRLHLPARLPLVMGDRYVLRDAGPGVTVGGGVILDVDPVLPASRARPDRDPQRVVRERGWVEAGQLRRLTGVDRAPDLGSWVVDPPALEQLRADLEEQIDRAGPLGLDVAALGDRERAVLPSVEGVVADQGRVRRRDAGDLLADHPLIAALDAEPFSPPSPEALGVDRSEVRELVKRGAAVESEGVVFSAAAVRRAEERLAARFEHAPEGLSVAEIRDELGTSRKFVLALLAVLDGTGRTRRRGDLRIAGPRLGGP